jgi:hypothetical protein
MPTKSEVAVISVAFVSAGTVTNKLKGVDPFIHSSNGAFKPKGFKSSIAISLSNPTVVGALPLVST